MGVITFLEHWFHGQYSWSMMTGFLTLVMVISSKCISETVIVPGASGQVLILTPLSVAVRVQFLTVIPSTFSSVVNFPRLPTLRPWPGPQCTFWTVICLLPSPIETQSSPVPMLVLRILTSVDFPMWIPSVLGLSPGAAIVKPSNVIFLHPKTITWKFLLSLEVTSRTMELLTKLKPKFCWNRTRKTHLQIATIICPCNQNDDQVH